jgi:hypothetical protein
VKQINAWVDQAIAAAASFQKTRHYFSFWARHSS